MVEQKFRHVAKNSSGFAAKKRIAVHLELAGVVFTSRASKRVTRRPNPDFDKSRFLKHPLPARARQAAGNSRSP
jgi:hypothetical protein